jgi:hypothetical protein
MLGDASWRTVGFARMQVCAPSVQEYLDKYLIKRERERERERER